MNRRSSGIPSQLSSDESLADVARHVIGCHLTPETGSKEKGVSGVDTWRAISARHYLKELAHLRLAFEWLREVEILVN
jgi:hypothetical protein